VRKGQQPPLIVPDELWARIEPLVAYHFIATQWDSLAWCSQRCRMTR
jgi:hypothetical protein